MKKTNFTLFSKHTFKFLLFVGLFALTSIQNTYAQCSLACNGTVNVSLDDAMCEAQITVSMIADTSGCDLGEFLVVVYDEYGNEIPDAIVTNEYVGQTLEVAVFDTISNNHCWGYLFIEDKLPPTIDCGAPASIFCYEIDNFTPTATDNCDDNVEVVLLSETVTPCDDTFADDVLKRVTRTYIAIDDQGLESGECVLEFDILRIESLDSIDIPASLLLSNDTNLECDENYPLDEFGNPRPDGPNGTGVPELDGNPLFPDFFTECNLLVTYDDTELPPIGCVTKIMRTWSIIEWSCAGDQRSDEFVQMIEIADNEGPSITCPDELEYSTNNTTCEATVLLPPATVVDNCSDNVTVDIEYPGGFINNSNGGLAQLPMGEYTITYIAYDECLNSSTCEVAVSVGDMTPPVAICDQNTAVSLTTDGTARVPAHSFDDGSYDECGLRYEVVRRMNPEPCDCIIPEFDGYDYLGERNGKYYYYSQWAYTFKHAKKEAQALDGTLAVLSSPSEFDFVNNIIQDTYSPDSYYMGLERTSNSTFNWVDGANLTFSRWNAGEPDNLGGNQDAVAVDNTGRWSDVADTTTRKFVIEIDDICGFSKYANFCCADVGDEDIMVVFRVIDEAGNYNECMVNVEVQDKLPAIIACPDDVTVDCDFAYDLEDLASSFGSATVYDNCSLTPVDEDHVVNLNQCNIGTITRTFTVDDGSGSPSTCEQVITFFPQDPFNDGVPDSYPDTDISWPIDVTMEGCADPESSEYHPDNLPTASGWPTFTEGPCDLVGAEYDDQVFPFNNPNGDACFKIIRTWTVIDWCQFVTINGTTTYPSWTHVQIIKINDPEAPTITSSCEPVSTCTYDSQCLDGFIELTATATDECTDVLRTRYYIDYNFNGTFVADFTSSPSAGNTINASGTYAIGSHVILYSFEDKCGNVTSCQQEFTIANCKAPTPYCYDGLAVDLMPIDTDGDGEADSGMVTMWASDFDAGSNHPCGYEVYLSFNPVEYDPNGNYQLPNGDRIQVDTGMVFTCEDLGDTPVSMYAAVVTPEGMIVQAFCNTTINIQDNMGVCGDNINRADVSGNIATYEDENLENAMIYLNGSNMEPSMTSDEGMYAFPSMPMGGNYAIVPQKNDDYTNGVNTLDLVMIQRHILEIQTLENPYKIIASDINGDNDVTVSDLLELRKLILGIIDEIPDNGSWRFIDADFEFDPESNPFDATFPEQYDIVGLDNDMIIDFVALKVGDVNSDAVANLKEGNSESRSLTTMTLETTDKEFFRGETVNIPVMTTESNVLTGFQFTMEVAEGLEFAGLTSETIEISDNNIGFSRINEGFVTISWNHPQGVEVESDVALFELVFEATSSGSIANSLDINSNVLSAEMYDGGLETYGIEFNIDGRGANAGAFKLYQNTPNPFDVSTQIAFDLPSNENVTLTVFTVTGQVVKVISDNYSKGYNTITIDRNEIGNTGVLYYTIEAGAYSATKKMILID